MFTFARVLEAAGIVYVGYAIFSGMRDGLSPPIGPTAVGIALFYLGRLIERRA